MICIRCGKEIELIDAHNLDGSWSDSEGTCECGITAYTDPCKTVRYQDEDNKLMVGKLNNGIDYDYWIDGIQFDSVETFNVALKTAYPLYNIL